MEENNKSKKFMLFGLIVLVITIAVSSTYAYYVWTTSDNEVTKIVAGVGSATVTFDGGSDINASLRPVSDKSKGIVKEIKVKADTTGLTFNMYLDITSIATELKDVSFRYEFYKGSTKLKEGNFSDTYLNSNTTDCSTNSTKHITLLTGESIGTTNSVYTLYVWIDGANYVNPSTMMGKEFNFKLHTDGEGAVVKTPPTAAETITELYTNASKTTVTNNSITYNTAPSVSLMNDRLGSTSVGIDSGNIRYYGASPNNYIYFNCSDYSNQSSSTCETWRIIGVFNGKLKIIRNTFIGSYSWDNKNTSTGAETAYGKNDWTTARLMKLLNSSDYYTTDSNDNGLGQSLYWNSSSGKCYYNQNNATTNYDFTSTGIKNDTTRNLISEETWNIGGWNSSFTYSNQFYGYERGTKVYSGRPTTWTGKIGLMYPSDYGYAADLSKCTNKQLSSYNDSTCTSNDWLFNSVSQWTLAPYSGYSYGAWAVATAGDVYYYNAYYAFGVRPVLYLASDLAMESGDGTSSNPYKLSA